MMFHVKKKSELKNQNPRPSLLYCKISKKSVWFTTKEKIQKNTTPNKKMVQQVQPQV